MSASDDQILSIQFREFTDALPTFTRRSLQAFLVAAFSAGSLRNAQLWTENGAQTRNFINSRTDPLERHRRRAFAQSLLAQRPSTMPTKSQTFSAGDTSESIRFASYVTSQWVLGDTSTEAGLRLVTMGSDGSLTMTYDADSPRMGIGELLDPDDPEWDDLLLDE